MKRMTTGAVLLLTVLTRVAWASETPRAPTGRLFAGWNLVALPSGVDEWPPEWQALGLEAWVAPDFLESGEPGSFAGSSPVKSLVGGVGYWVHSDRELLYALSVHDTPRTSSSTVAEGWHVLSPNAGDVYADPNIDRVLEWDAQAGAYRPLRVGDGLELGRGYWGHVRNETTPLVESCFLSEWSFSAARTLIDTCPISSGAGRVVSRAEWSMRRPVSQDEVASTSIIVVDHTKTKAAHSVALFEDRAMLHEKKGDLDHHFIISTDHEGGWQIFEGRAFPTSASGETGLPREIRVAVMGTYEPVRVGDLEETQFGPSKDAPEALRQPARSAVLRLFELVAYLSARYPEIIDIVPYAQGSRAAYPGQGLSPGHGMLHLFAPLRARFFKAENRGEAVSATPRFDAADSDRVAPVLLVTEPARALTTTREHWVLLGGEVWDAHLEGLYLNGVRVADRNTSFSEVYYLDEGLNTVELSAVDHSGNQRAVTRRILRDQEVPVIHVTSVVASDEVRLDVDIDEDNLARVLLNGRSLSRMNVFSYHVATEKLAEGKNDFSFRVFDEAGNGREHTVTLNKDASGQVTAFQDASLALSSRPKAPLQATSVSADIAPPVVTVASPVSSLVYSNHPSWTFRGTVQDPNLSRVTLNGVPVAATSGSFAQPLGLLAERTDFRLIAADDAGNRDEQRFTIVLDEAAPSVEVFGAKSRVVHTPEFTLRGFIEDANLRAAVLLRDDGSTVASLDAGRFTQKLSLVEGFNIFVIKAEDHALNQSSVTLELRYQAGLSVAQTPRAPDGFSATVHKNTASMSWRAPRLFDDGGEIPAGVELVYYLYRNDERVGEALKGSSTQDVVPSTSQAYRYHVSAVVLDRAGNGLESEPSERIHVDFSPAKPVTAPGRFEAPVPLDDSGLPAALPQTALSKWGGKTLAHVAYASRRSAAEGDRIVYQRSEKAGKPGSFEAPQHLADPGPGWTISDVALASRDERVSVAWIQKNTEQEATSSEAQSELYVVESQDGGQSFGPQKLIRGGPEWKRGLDMGYDRFFDHHLVWGQKSKAYYLKNLEGTPENVFDVEKREKNTIVVDYHNLYKTECPEDPECGCTEFPHEEYSYALDRDPDTGKRIGPYLHRTEIAWVYNPSLELDDDKISISVRQDRMWDDRPIRNPSWRGEYGPIVPPRELNGTRWCGQENARSHQQGFMEVFERRSGREGLAQRKVLSKSEVEFRSSQERSDEVAYAYYHGEGNKTFYAYDEGVAHDKDWYFFLADGTWHEKDEIKIAQRPLVTGAWSDVRTGKKEVPVWPIESGLLEWTEEQGSIEHGFRQGAWVDGVKTEWRILTAASPTQNGSQGKLAHPQLVSAADGHWALVYEDGDSEDPNASGFNPIQYRSSVDGGLSWSIPQTLATGYLPQLGVTKSGTGTLMYYTPSSQSSGSIEVVEIADRGQGLSDATPINAFPAKPVHWQSHGSGADSLSGVPSLVALDELVFAAWVEQKDGRDRVVTARASTDARVAGYDVELPTYVTSSKSGRIRVTAENTYHMRVSSNETVTLSDDGVVRGGGIESASLAMSIPFSSFEVQLSEGQSTAWTELTSSPTSPSGNAFVAAAALSTADSGPLVGALPKEFEGQDTYLAIRRARPPPGGQRHTPTFAPTSHGNYQKAKYLRNRLLRFQGVKEEGQVDFYQVEYALDDPESGAAERWLGEELWNEGGLYKDAKHLAGFERVWAYTQGIALSQFARQRDPSYHKKAQGLARYLCRHAVRGAGPEGEPAVLGWHFSWNTDGDDWKDARLVTGATAWVIHGLGEFLTSEAYATLPTEDQADLKGCYEQALVGLTWHRVQRTEASGAKVSLVTAGWTVRGLVSAQHPELMFDFAESEHWGYYSVLDAVGYDTYNEEQPPEVTRWYKRGHAIAGNDEVNIPPRVLTAEELEVLKARVLARNVVTEHSLDVLSVLNHALEHADEIGLSDPGYLKTWRDELRDGIFLELWDDEGWRADLEAIANDSTMPGDRKALSQGALSSGDMGRVITGGRLLSSDAASKGTVDRPASAGWSVANPSTDSNSFVLEPSRHVAIDNCSWLSLSVDYASLGDQPEYVEKLARCLEFTVLRFSRDIDYEGKSYYGTHYFQNSFRDPYIEPSELQESSFHLEATTGLIQGLLEFAKAHPEHPKAAYLQLEAKRLWAGVQAFVADHGFPYSSQRIQDLSTRLSSSTAIIWFIDVYEDLGATFIGRGPQSPLRNYASGVDLKDTGRFVTESYLSLQEQMVEGGQTAEGDPIRFIRTTPSTAAGAHTRLDNQALALIVAVNRRDWENAEALADGILSTRSAYVWTDAQGIVTEVEEFPAVVDSTTGVAVFPYRDTGMQMMAYYALAWFLDADSRHSWIPRRSGLRERVRQGLRGLRTMFTHYYVDATEDSHLVQRFVAGDAVLGPPSDDGTAPMGRVDTADNILAYFAIRQAARLDARAQAENDALGADQLFVPTRYGSQWLEQFEHRLLDMCAGGLNPILFKQEDGTEHASFRASTRSLCVLFLSDAGYIEAAQYVLAGLGLEQSPPSSEGGLDYVPGRLPRAILNALASEGERPGLGDAFPLELLRSRFRQKLKVEVEESWGEKLGIRWDASEDEDALPQAVLDAMNEDDAFHTEAVSLAMGLWIEWVDENRDDETPEADQAPQALTDSEKWRTFQRDFVDLSTPWLHEFGEALARRALAHIDWRQDQLALEALDRLRNHSGLATHTQAAIVLLHNPDGEFGFFHSKNNGAFGVKRGPLFMLNDGADPTGKRALGNPSSRLGTKDALKSTLGALFLSDFTAFGFDFHLSRIARLLAWLNMHDLEIPPAEWDALFDRERTDRLERADHELSNLCHTEAFELAFLGLECDRLTQIYLELRANRVGGFAGSIAPHIAWSDPLESNELRGFVYAHHTGYPFLYRNRLGVANRPRLREPDLAPEATVQQMQAYLRQGMKNAFRDKVQDGLSTEGIHQYNFSDLDVIDALNPAAPMYWSGPALRFRTVLDLQGSMTFADKQALPQLDLPLEPSRAENVRTLRAGINESWDGDLVAAAWSAGYSPGVLHDALRTGIVPPELLTTLVETTLGAGGGLAFTDMNTNAFWPFETPDFIKDTQGSDEGIGTNALDPASTAAYVLYETKDPDACVSIYRYDAAAHSLEHFLAIGALAAGPYIVLDELCGKSVFEDKTIIDAYRAHAGEDYHPTYVVLSNDGSGWPGVVVKGQVVLPQNPYSGAGAQVALLAGTSKDDVFEQVDGAQLLVELLSGDWRSVQAFGAEQALLPAGTGPLVAIEPEQLTLYPTEDGGLRPGVFTISNLGAEPRMYDVSSPDSFLLIDMPYVTINPFTAPGTITVSVERGALIAAGFSGDAWATLEFKDPASGHSVTRRVYIPSAQATTNEVVSFVQDDAGWVHIGLQDQDGSVLVDGRELDADFWKDINENTPLQQVFRPLIQQGGKVLSNQLTRLIPPLAGKPAQLGYGEAMISATGLAAAVSMATGSVESWSTLVNLQSHPLPHEPWTQVGYVYEAEVTHLGGFGFQDESFIRGNVRILQSHVKGGFTTTTLEFEKNTIYGLVKEVHRPIEGGPGFLVPSSDLLAVYRLDTELTPDEVLDNFVETQFGWSQIEATVSHFLPDQELSAPKDFLKGWFGPNTDFDRVVHVGPVGDVQDKIVSAEDDMLIHQIWDAPPHLDNPGFDPATHGQFIRTQSQGTEPLDLGDGYILYWVYNPKCKPMGPLDPQFRGDAQEGPKELVTKREEGPCWEVVRCDAKADLMGCLRKLRQSYLTNERPFQSLTIPPTLGLSSLYMPVDAFTDSAFQNEKYKDQDEPAMTLWMEDHMELFFRQLQEKYGVTREQLESEYYVEHVITTNLGLLDPTERDQVDDLEEVPEESVTEWDKAKKDPDDIYQKGLDAAWKPRYKIKKPGLVVTITLVPRDPKLRETTMDTSMLRAYKDNHLYGTSLSDFLKKWRGFGGHSGDYLPKLFKQTSSSEQVRVRVIKIHYPPPQENTVNKVIKKIKVKVGRKPKQELKVSVPYQGNAAKQAN